MTGRRAGLMVPLFSLRSAGGWGIGEMADLGRFAVWMQHALMLARHGWRRGVARRSIPAKISPDSERCRTPAA